MAKKVYIIPDGPYEVDGDVPLRQVKTVVDAEGASEAWVDGREYETDGEKYYLCRCGHSSKKPFCDGTHEKVDFRGKTTAEHDIENCEAKVYEGQTLDMVDNEGLCASMRFCDRGINAWNAVENSEKEDCRALAIEEVQNCPSGRLTLFEKDGTPIEEAYEEEILPVEATVHECRGPLWVRGGISVESSDCKKYTTRNRLTLCRCGESKNKPFCDSSHVYCEHMKGFDK